MGLELNLYNEIHTCDCGKEIKRYEEFYGEPINQMPLLLEKRIPMSVAGIMKRRMGLKNTEKDVYLSWINNYFESSDMGAYSSEKKDEMKIILTVDNCDKITDLGKSFLAEINPKTPLKKGGNFLDAEKYNELQGEGIIRVPRKSEKFYDPFTKKEVLKNQEWRILLRHPDEVPAKFAIHGLHKEVIDYIFAEVQQKGGDEYAMSIIPDFIRNCSNMKLWEIDRIIDGANANNRDKLNNQYCRLIGELPSVPKCVKKQSCNKLNKF